MTTKLLCMFAKKNELHLTIEYIKEVFEFDRLFIFNTIKNPNQLFCTFAVNKYYDLINNIIIIHRKSETETLYTINAVNEIIRQINNGKMVNNYPINWELYKTQLLLYRNSKVEYIEYELFDKI